MTPPGSVPTAVRLDNVSKAFGARTVLDRVSLDIRAGSCCCVLGRSGTGKSVLLRHIIGLLAPDSGTVIVDGQDLAALDRRALAHARLRLGFLFQHAALFDSITVGENVAFPLRRHTRLADADIRQRARDKLAQVGLDREFDKMPAELSGGMRKRCGLARAMALDPPILLVDEPSAGLDPVTASEIDELLASLKHERGTTLVVVTHNIPSARALADEMVFLHEGRILQQGPVASFERSTHGIVRTFMASGGSTG
jgi:phospholipid/cholesterol/gamma-HCH transport system ATP-binding protein